MEHAKEILDVPCHEIEVGERFRKTMGDLTGLTESIRENGVLQPIGITEDKRLVFGHRRLLVVKDILQLPTIPARVVRLSNILIAQHDENEMRLDFTPSERVAIAEAVRAEIGNRSGQRTDMEPGQNIGQVVPGAEPGQNIGQVSGSHIDEVAAKKAGFGNPETYRQARKVVAVGTPELVDAMDAREVSISAAAVIADQPAERQVKILQLPRAEKKVAVRELRRKKLPKHEKNVIVREQRRRELPSTDGAPSTKDAPGIDKEHIDAMLNLTKALLVIVGIAPRVPPGVIAAEIRKGGQPSKRLLGGYQRVIDYLTDIKRELTK